MKKARKRDLRVIQTMICHLLRRICSWDEESDKK
jgi:hypothetical protein